MIAGYRIIVSKFLADDAKPIPIDKMGIPIDPLHIVLGNIHVDGYLVSQKFYDELKKFLKQPEMEKP